MIAEPAEVRPLTRRAHEAVPDEGGTAFPELLLYVGNACNRDCFFCCIEGSPDGWYGEFEQDAPARILSLVEPEARIKLYGGEPTLSHGHVVWLIRGLRAAGYRGRVTVFSNGIQADHLITILEADPPSDTHAGSDCYLNPHIWEGRGVEPIPSGRRRMLERWADQNPDRLWLSHDDVLPVGAAEDGTTRPDPEGDSEAPLPLPDEKPFGGRCARCWPTVRSDGRIHACAFAAEEASDRYTLGHLGDTSAEALRSARDEFLRWIDNEIEPRATAEGVLPCEVCVRSARAMTEAESSPKLPVL